MEVVVASLLFMLVFCISMETLTRIYTLKHDDSLLAVEMSLDAAVHEFSTGAFSDGEYTRSYPWGEITVCVEPYKESGRLRALTFTARAGSRIIRYRTLAVSK